MYILIYNYPITIIYYIYIYIYIVGEKIFDPLLILYVGTLTKNDQSIILMVGLFEQ